MYCKNSFIAALSMAVVGGFVGEEVFDRVFKTVKVSQTVSLF